MHLREIVPDNILLGIPSGTALRWGKVEGDKLAAEVHEIESTELLQICSWGKKAEAMMNKGMKHYSKTERNEIIVWMQKFGATVPNQTREELYCTSNEQITVYLLDVRCWRGARPQQK